MFSPLGVVLKTRISTGEASTGGYGENSPAAAWTSHLDPGQFFLPGPTSAHLHTSSGGRHGTYHARGVTYGNISRKQQTLSTTASAPERGRPLTNSSK